MTLYCPGCQAAVSECLAGFWHGCPYCRTDRKNLVSDDVSDESDQQARRVEA